MAKIKVSTVRQMADVQVINLNANFVSRAVRVHMHVEEIIDAFEHERATAVQLGEAKDEEMPEYLSLYINMKHLMEIRKFMSDMYEAFVEETEKED